jgi:Fe-S cluster biogenesis protein NfuA
MDQSEKIKIALNSIRPFLQKDGGDVELIDVKANRVRVKLTGACESCAMSHMTLRVGIEEAVKSAIPEIEAVEAI